MISSEHIMKLQVYRANELHENILRLKAELVLACAARIITQG
jgi:hypothetical protein